jgi:hypothetical protein
VLSELEKPQEKPVEKLAEKFDLSMFDEEEEKPQLAPPSKSTIQLPAMAPPMNRSPLPPMNRSPLPPMERSSAAPADPMPASSVEPVRDPSPSSTSPLPPTDPSLSEAFSLDPSGSSSVESPVLAAPMEPSSVDSSSAPADTVSLGKAASTEAVDSTLEETSPTDPSASSHVDQPMEPDPSPPLAELSPSLSAEPLPATDLPPVEASPKEPTPLPSVDPSPPNPSTDPVTAVDLPPPNPVRFSVKATRVVTTDQNTSSTQQGQQPTVTAAATTTTAVTSTATSNISSPRSFVIQGSIVGTQQQEPQRPQQQQQPQRHQFTVVGQLVRPNTITPGVVLPTLQPPPLTAEALAAHSVQYEDHPEDLRAAPKPSDIQSSSSTLYAIKTAETSRSREYSLSMPFRSLVETFQTLHVGVTEKFDQMRTEKRKVDETNIRELYPRMPWHDVHGCITGLPVRDLAAHFIQRWNHHRVSKSAHDSRPILTDITDNPYFSICAKCNLTNIFETATHCPTCNYYLGPAKLPLAGPSPAPAATTTGAGAGGHPVMKSPQDYVSSWITYDCYFVSQLGCRIQGDGPSLVTLILNPEIVSKIIEGQLIETSSIVSRAHPEGTVTVTVTEEEREREKEQLSSLSAHGYRPIIGDVLVAIEDTKVLHLNSIEVQRFIKRQKLKLKRLAEMANNSAAGDCASVSSSRSGLERRVKVTFRRHFVNNVDDLVTHDAKVRAYLATQTATQTVTVTAPPPPAAAAASKESMTMLSNEMNESKVWHTIPTSLSLHFTSLHFWCVGRAMCVCSFQFFSLRLSHSLFLFSVWEIISFSKN